MHARRPIWLNLMRRQRWIYTAGGCRSSNRSARMQIEQSFRADADRAIVPRCEEPALWAGFVAQSNHAPGSTGDSAADRGAGDICALADRTGRTGARVSGELRLARPRGFNAVDHFTGALVVGRARAPHPAIPKTRRSCRAGDAAQSGLGKANTRGRVRV